MIGSALDRYEGVPVGPGGTFRLRVPGDRPIRLVPTHPKLVAAQADGDVTVTVPRDGVELPLVHGGRVRFTLDTSAASDMTPDARAIHYAQLFRSGLGAIPASTHRIEFQNDVGSFTGAPAGAWTVWLDVSPFQPKMLPAVPVDREETDLGRIAFDRGSDLEVHFTDRPGHPPRGFGVTAWALSEPRYSRATRGAPGEPCVLHGLGPGRFRIKFTLDGNFDPDPRDFEITAVGHSRVKLDYEPP